jgi:hypothetical protein
MGSDPNVLLPVEIARLVGLGYRVEAAPVPGQVVMVRGRRANHVLHLLLSVVTVGLWLPVWLLVGLGAREHRIVVSEAQLAARGRVPVPSGRMSAGEARTYAVVMVVVLLVAAVVQAGA